MSRIVRHGEWIHAPEDTRRSAARKAPSADSLCYARPMAESDSDVVVVISAVPVGDAAARLARTLVDERLCACVNVISGGSC